MPVLAETTIEMPGQIYSAEVGAAEMPSDLSDLSDLDPKVWRTIHEDLELLTGSKDARGES